MALTLQPAPSPLCSPSGWVLPPPSPPAQLKGPGTALRGGDLAGAATPPARHPDSPLPTTSPTHPRSLWGTAPQPRARIWSGATTRLLSGFWGIRRRALWRQAARGRSRRGRSRPAPWCQHPAATSPLTLAAAGCHLGEGAVTAVALAADDAGPAVATAGFLVAGARGRAHGVAVARQAGVAAFRAVVEVLGEMGTAVRLPTGTAAKAGGWGTAGAGAACWGLVTEIPTCEHRWLPPSSPCWASRATRR